MGLTNKDRLQVADVFLGRCWPVIWSHFDGCQGCQATKKNELVGSAYSSLFLTNTSFCDEDQWVNEKYIVTPTPGTSVLSSWHKPLGVWVFGWVFFLVILGFFLWCIVGFSDLVRRSRSHLISLLVKSWCFALFWKLLQISWLQDYLSSKLVRSELTSFFSSLSFQQAFCTDSGLWANRWDMMMQQQSQAIAGMFWQMQGDKAI